MVILTLDDERLALENLNAAVRAVVPDAVIHAFQSSTEALAAVHNGLQPDVAFLDIAMPDISGIACGKEIRLCSGATNIIFTTGFSDYLSEAFSMHANGYLRKPITPQKIRQVLDTLHFHEHSPTLAARKKKRAESEGMLRIITFGDFQVFKGETSIHFKYRKTYELLAYLVDRRGVMCPNKDLYNILWPNSDPQKHVSYFQNLKSDLVNTLASHGLPDCIQARYRSIGLNPDKVDCDYFNWLDGDPWAVNSYNGQYMSQYPWAESTHIYIESRQF